MPVRSHPAGCSTEVADGIAVAPLMTDPRAVSALAHTAEALTRQYPDSVGTKKASVSLK